ncbi:hypothetical protein NSQ29_19425 [Paenibacillus sp. FSL F4-0236]
MYVTFMMSTEEGGEFRALFAWNTINIIKTTIMIMKYVLNFK